MLILSRKVDERIMIGDKIELSVVEIRGDHVKLGIVAPKDVKVYRQEVYEAIQRENVVAAGANVDLPFINGMIEKNVDVDSPADGESNAGSGPGGPAE